MNYEYLIRGAFKCGRGAVYGANADVYRTFQGSDSDYQKTKTEVLAYTFGVNAGGVAANLSSAMYKVISDNEKTISPEQIENFERMYSILQAPTLENVDNVIAEIQPIFIELGIFPIR